MNKNIKYIIREVFEPDFEFYFDTDCFNKNGGDYCYTLFAVSSHYGNYSSGLNSEDFEEITRELDNICGDLDSIGYYYKNIKEIMQDYKIPYSPTKAHELKNLCNISHYVDQICAYLTIKTGKTWTTREARGYCQGDYAEMIYCEKHYTEEQINVICDLYMGCGKEFSITFLDDSGEEPETVYGYYVADCEAYTDEGYKTVICNQEGLEPEKTTLEMIETVKTITTPVYRTA